VQWLQGVVSSNKQAIRRIRRLHITHCNRTGQLCSTTLLLTALVCRCCLLTFAGVALSAVTYLLHRRPLPLAHTSHSSVVASAAVVLSKQLLVLLLVLLLVVHWQRACSIYSCKGTITGLCVRSCS
jgi:hypothetical protein